MALFVALLLGCLNSGVDGMDDRISPYFMVGTTWVGDDGYTYKLTRSGHPHLTITISTFNVLHWYGSVRAEQPSVHNIDTDEFLYLGGYGENKPNLYGHFRHNATRILERVERDTRCIELGDIGDETERFNSDIEAFEGSLDCALAKFRDTKTRHWDVQFDYCGARLDGHNWRLHTLTSRRRYLINLFKKRDD